VGLDLIVSGIKEIDANDDGTKRKGRPEAGRR